MTIFEISVIVALFVYIVSMFFIVQQNKGKVDKKINIEKKTCPFCGRKISVDAKICPYCNKVLKENENE